MRRASVPRCSTTGTRQAFVPGRTRSKTARGRGILAAWSQMSRSTKGWDSGTRGTVLISSISRIRRFAVHRCALNTGSWAVLTYRGKSWPRIAALNIRHTSAAVTVLHCTPKPTRRRVHWSMTTSTQQLRSTIDSQRKRSTLHRLSVVWPMNDNHEGPVPRGRER